MAIEPKKNIMPTQDPKERSCNFHEVALGYDLETAQREAHRCLNCKNKPCVEGCPVNIDIPGFIDLIKKGDIEGSYRHISLSSSFRISCLQDLLS